MGKGWKSKFYTMSNLRFRFRWDNCPLSSEVGKRIWLFFPAILFDICVNWNFYHPSIGGAPFARAFIRFSHASIALTLVQDLPDSSFATVRTPDAISAVSIVSQVDGWSCADRVLRLSLGSLGWCGDRSRSRWFDLLRQFGNWFRTHFNTYPIRGRTSGATRRGPSSAVAFTSGALITTV